MAEAARPTRLTRQNISVMQSKENQVFNQKNILVAKRPTAVRATLGEISNRQSATLINIGNKAGVLKKTIAPVKSSNTLLLKNNASKENPTFEKPKSLAVRTSTVINGRPLVRPSVSTKPLAAAAKPATNVLTRMSSLIPSKTILGVQNVNKPRSSTLHPVASKTLIKPKQSDALKPVVKQVESALQFHIKQEEKVTGFSTEQLNKLHCLEQEDKDDPQSVVDYVRDIYEYMNRLEIEYSVPNDYMKHCKYLTYNMRAVLIDWLIEVHRQFKLLPETLYLAVSIFDRYMPLAPDTVKVNLQLVGIVCLLLAAKYEEIMCPTVGDCTYITDNAYTSKQVMDMEMKILAALKFNVGRPLPLHFLRRYTKAAGASYVHHSVAKYFMELMLVRHEMCHVVPSLQAAAALCLSIWVNNVGENPNFKMQDAWNYKLQYFSGYSFKQVDEALQSLVVVVAKGHKSSLQAVKKKYSSKHHMETTYMVEELIPKIGALYL